MKTDEIVIELGLVSEKTLGNPLGNLCEGPQAIPADDNDVDPYVC